MARFAEREKAEWDEADLIVCGSEYDVRGIRDGGGPVDRCAIVPRGIDLAAFRPPEARKHECPLRVLTVGTVCLRKGAPYVLQAARRLQGRAVFRMAGAINVLPAARERLREHVELLGVVPRSEILSQYAWAHVMLLPSICEGSATSTYEALACGLPVICTPNAGSVVRDGIDGFLVPPGDAEAIIGRLEELAASPDRWNFLSENTKARRSFVSVRAYESRLLEALRRLYLR
jgi:glycosyltransferase involved in cell wall biosynthesis